MKEYVSGSIEDYLAGLAARKSVPGGGSASALTGGMGAALNLMVINYSAGGGAESELETSRHRQEESMRKFTRMIDEDCRAFDSLMRVLKEKKDAEDNYKRAALAPMEVCRECHVSIDISLHLLENSNRNLLTDIGCASGMLRAGFDSASLNVRVNLKYIKDAAFVRNAEKALSSMSKDVFRIHGQIATEIRNRMGPVEKDA
jgi:formiminotetrahydrofolate cyclodeaminase